MKKYRSSKSAFFNSRVLVGLAFCSIVSLVALLGFAVSPGGNALAESKQPQQDVAAGPAYGSVFDGAPSQDIAPSAPIETSSEINRVSEIQPDSSCATVFSENFDSVVAPALPAGWVATLATGTGNWVTSVTTPDSVPNDAFADDPAVVSDKYLDTPSIVVASGPALLSFRNFYSTESTFDGGVLEVSSPNINVGSFTDVTAVAVGGSFINGGYNGLISTQFSSPIGGRNAWTGSSTTYINTLVNLGPNVVGQTIKLRFRMASDTSVSAAGWRVDTLSLTVACGTPSPTPTATPDASGCSWSAAAVVPATVLDMPVVTVGSNIYAFGGVSTTITATSRKFDGTTWSTIASLPVGLEFAAAVTDGTNAYVLGGAEPTAGTPQTTLYRYNVGADTYTTLAPFTTGTWNHAAVYLNGKIYKFAGTAASGSTSALEIYDVGSNTWSAGAAYPLAISFVSAFVQGNFIYACGGIDSVTSTASTKTYRYDPSTNTWDDLAIADLPASRWASATAFYANRGVLAGGYVGGAATANISTSVISWDSGTNAWTTLPNMLAERSRMTGAILGGCFHVIGGRSIASPNFVGTNDNQRICCATGTPTPSPTPCPLCTPTPTPTPSPTPPPTPTPTSTPSPTGTPCAMPTTVLSQDFEAGLGAWTTTNTSTTTGTGNPALCAWTVQTNPYTPGVSSSETLNSGGGTQFVMTNSDLGGSGVSANTALNSPSINATGMSTLRLAYRHYYRDIGATDTPTVEVSTAGAAGPWTVVRTYTATTGAAAAFVADSIVLDAFAGNPDVRIRFHYVSSWDWYWAIDDIVVSTCGGGGTPSPTPTFVISGKVANCSSPAPTATPPAAPTPATLPGTPNVLMTLSGSASGTTLTDASGNYSFTVAGGGSYTVTPSKASIPPAGANINNLDVLAIQRHFLLIATIPVGCRLTAADANVNAIVNSQDVLAVQRFFLGFTSGIGSVGQYKFVPASRTYPTIAANQTAQNYEVYVVGDAAASFNNRPGTNENDMGFSSVASVALPDVAPARSMTNFTAPVTTSAVDASERIVGFQGDFTFDERVVKFADQPIEKAGLTAGNWNVTGNVLPGNGPIRTLRISAYSGDFSPLSGAGTLFQLKMERVSQTSEGTPLVWSAAPDNFIYINSDLQTQRPGSSASGSVSASIRQR